MNPNGVELTANGPAVAGPALGGEWLPRSSHARMSELNPAAKMSVMSACLASRMVLCAAKNIPDRSSRIPSTRGANFAEDS
jgi:hypothetical protein